LPEMNTLVTERQDIWHMGIDISLLFREHKVEVREKCRYYLLCAGIEEELM